MPEMANDAEPVSEQTVVERLAEIRQSFIDSLKEKLLDIDSAALVALSDQCSLTAIERLTGLTHKLAGAAGTFGLNDLGDAGSALENYLLLVVKSPNPPPDILTPEQKKQIRSLVDNVQTTIQQAPSQADGLSTNSHQWRDDARDESSEVKRLIVVDDDAVQAEVLKVQLSNFGFDVTPLSRLDHLKEEIGRVDPSAIIMDIMFPGNMDGGLLAITDLRARGVINCPVIFLSRRNDFAARLAAVRAGGDGYVEKPVNIIKLLDTINQLLDRNKVQPFRILIVEDDEDTAELYCAILENAGLVAAKVTRPEDSLSWLETFQPDVILMDLHMPGCSGAELAVMIRQLRDRFLQVPIVFLTTERGMDQRLKTMRAGADSFLSKPIEPELLVATIAARAERARSLRDLFSKLQSSEEQFRSVAQSAHEAIFSCDDKGIIIFWNEGAETILGYREDEVIGRSTSIIIPEGIIEMYDRLVAADSTMQNEKGTIDAIESTVQTGKGHYVQVEISLSEWWSQGRRYLTAIIRDISARKKIESDLRDARKKADQANHAKSEFLSSMSHELRTPMNAILGFAQLLDQHPREKLSKFQQECVTHILQGGSHLLDLINEVLDMAHIESGQVSLDLEDIPLDQVINECITVGEQIAENYGVKIDNPVFPPFLPPVHADRMRLKQIFLNLLSNAAKYNHQGGRITIECIITDQSMIRTIVSDTGIGIAAEKQEFLFEPFARLGTEKSEVEGTGIGLAITRQLTLLMGGQIGFESEHGAGSRFWVDIPVSGSEAD